MLAHNFAKKLKALVFKAPFEFLIQEFKKNPKVFNQNPKVFNQNPVHCSRTKQLASLAQAKIFNARPR